MSLLTARISAAYGANPPVLRDAALSLSPGETLGLVGESGSGKSTLALALLGLLGMRGGRVTGSIRFAGRELVGLRERDLRPIRGREIGFVPQSPAAALNPLLRVRTHLEEAWQAHARGSAPVRETLESVSLPSNDGFLKRYPGELSTGQGQRLLIAMGILHRPALVIADEPTSALDVITQAEILSLFARLNRELGMALLYISHDLLSIATLCRRVTILYEGQAVETGECQQIFREPKHPYTRRLVDAIPRNSYLNP